MKTLIRPGKTLSPETILFILAVLGSALYISLIFNDNLWVDEAFTASLIRGTFPEVIRDTVNDTLPPFYNILGFLAVSLFGFSAPVLKFCSCLPMILLLFFGGRKLYSIRGFRPAFLYELFLMSMPHFIHYGVEIRMYSWGVFSCGMAALCFLTAAEDKKALRAMMLFTVFSGYIHHFALVSCGMLWLILLLCLLRGKRTDELISALKMLGIFLILYLPGLILSAWQIKNASSYFAMAPLSIRSFMSDLRFPFVTNLTPLSAALLISVIFAAAFSLLKDRDAGTLQGVMLLSVLYLTLLFAYLVSFLFGRSLFTARYLVPSLSVLWLGAAILWDKVLSFFEGRNFLTPILIALIAFTGVTGYLNMFKEEYSPGAEIMKDYFSANLTADDACIIDEDVPEIGICFDYYFPKLKRTDWKNADKIKGNLWYIEKNGSENSVEKAEKYRYNLKYINGFFFDRYSFSLYRAEKEDRDQAGLP